ncbi:MAG: endo alpha-1,4 polygalactosaminidase [Anaerolineae bacterium]
MKAPAHFACYYGHGMLDRLSRYDLVIVQAEHYAPAEITWLQNRGTLVVGYVSIGEVPLPAADSAWTLKDSETGKAVVNPTWQTALTDCRSEPWRTYLVERRIPQLLASGVDGLFLDNVDEQAQHPGAEPCIRRLLRGIRWRTPGRSLLINRGFALLSVVSEVADGLVFEAFTSYFDGHGYAVWEGADLAWTAQMARRLQRLRLEMPILTIDYAAPDDEGLRHHAEMRARDNGFVPFVSTNRLDWLPPAPVSDSHPSGGSLP